MDDKEAADFNELMYDMWVDSYLESHWNPSWFAKHLYGAKDVIDVKKMTAKEKKDLSNFTIEAMKNIDEDE